VVGIDEVTMQHQPPDDEENLIHVQRSIYWLYGEVEVVHQLAESQNKDCVLGEVPGESQ
jgi:hypothetical protein